MLTFEMCKAFSENKICEKWITYSGAVASLVLSLPHWICTLMFLQKLLVEIRFLELLSVGKQQFCLVIILRFGTCLSQASYKFGRIKTRIHFLPRLVHFYTKEVQRRKQQHSSVPDLRKNSSVMGFLYFLCRFPYQTIPLKASIFLVYTNFVKIQRGL